MFFPIVDLYSVAELAFGMWNFNVSFFKIPKIPTLPFNDVVNIPHILSFDDVN